MFRVLALFTAFFVTPALAQVPPYVQRTMTWWGPAGLLGVNFWVSGVPMNPAAPRMRAFVFPSWVPQQFYITRCKASHQTSGQTQVGGEFSVVVDVGHKMFKSGVPPYYQGPDHSQIIALCTIKAEPNDPQLRTEIWDPPVFFDQAVDGLWLQQDMNTVDQFTFALGILTPNTNPPPQ